MPSGTHKVALGWGDRHWNSLNFAVGRIEPALTTLRSGRISVPVHEGRDSVPQQVPARERALSLWRVLAQSLFKADWRGSRACRHFTQGRYVRY